MRFINILNCITQFVRFETELSASDSRRMRTVSPSAKIAYCARYVVWKYTMC